MVFAPAARAAEPSLAGFSAEALGGIGFQLNGPGNPFGPGFGLRAGYMLEPGFFLGGSGAYYFGLEPGDGETGLLEGEVGFDLPLGRGSLRPYLGAGVAAIRDQEMFACAADSGPQDCFPVERGFEPKFLWTLGARGAYPVAELLQLGLDARFHIMPDEQGFTESGLRVAFAVHAVVGARL